MNFLALCGSHFDTPYSRQCVACGLITESAFAKRYVTAAGLSFEEGLGIAPCGSARTDYCPGMNNFRETHSRSNLPLYS